VNAETETLPAAAPAQRNALAVLNQELVAPIERKVQAWVGDGQLQLPPNYSVANAMKSAWLILQDTVDKDKKPVLQSCDRNSIANALMDMAVQGLNPAKKQLYFIAYGNKLTMQRSYQGAVALAKRACPAIADIFAEVVYEGDVLTYEIVHGQKRVVKHEQALANVDKKKIVAAYAEVVNHEGVVTHSVIKTLAEIHQAWRQSRQNPFLDSGQVKSDSVHGKFPADMCKRTVINAVTKPIIATSDDASILGQSLARTARAAEDAELDEEIAERANGGVLEVVTSQPASPAPAEPDGGDGTGDTVPAGQLQAQF
jgi:recombination protein RecT